MMYIGFFVFLLGLIIGSFLNVVIVRLQAQEGLLGRSHCRHCKKIIRWYDNIPVASYLMLRGKCRACTKSFSIEYPLVEFFTGLLFLLFFVEFAPIITSYDALMLITHFIFVSLLIVIFVYDLRWYIILDVITLPAIVIAFILNIYLGMSWSSLLVAGIIGGGFFLLQYAVSKGKWIGGGDIRLGFLMGMMLGFPMILIALMIAYLLGTIISLPLVFIGKRHRGDKIPFGTFLSTATIISLLWGEPILTWYIGLIF